MKKALSVFLTFCMIFTFAVTGVCENEVIPENKNQIEGSEVFWELVTETDEQTSEVLKTTLVFDGNGEIPDYSDDEEEKAAPWSELEFDSIEFGKGITKIGSGAFAGSKELKTVVIPETVTEIGEKAFCDCQKLESAEINADIKTLKNRTFSECVKLKSITLPASLETIEMRTFYNCNLLENVSLPEKLVSIGEHAFTKCESITGIIIPDSVKEISRFAFYQCGKLAELTIGSGMEKIEEDVFDSCIALKSVDIPEGVTEIANGAFNGCTELSSVTFPESLKTIGDNAFNLCTSLKAVYLGKNVSTIGTKSLGYGKRNNKVEGFTITGFDNTAAQKYAVDNGFNFNSLNNGSCGEEAVWSFNEETGVLAVSGKGAMKNYDLEQLPEYNRFKGQIKEITIGEEITSIGDYAFYNISVNGMTVPKTVETIGEKAIGNFIDEIVADGFYFCGYFGSAADKYASDNEIGFRFIAPITGKCGEKAEWSFDEETGTLTITGEGATDNYTIDNLPDYNRLEVKNVVVDEGITSLGDFALVFDRDIESIVFPQTLTAIGENTPFGFRRVQGEETSVLEKTEEIKVSAYDETPVKAYAETNGFEYISLNPKPQEFPKLVIDNSIKAVLDNAGKLIYLYQTDVEKTVFEENFNKADYTEAAVSTDKMATDTTLTLTANDETQVYSFILPGDTSCDAQVNSADALRILQHAVGSEQLENGALAAGNLNGDDTINSADALIVLQISVGQIELASLMPVSE